MDKFVGKKSSVHAKNIYLKTQISVGSEEFTLGRNTTRILNEDPKLLLFTMARYKFIAKMFVGFDHVLEVGCQEGFGAPIVAQSVGWLLGIDFYTPHIESCNRRIKSAKMEFKTFDILDKPIDHIFQGAFALDVLEHIEKENEHIFMQNICDSISDDGVVILGMPSLQSQQYASKLSKLGHVNCKTSEEFKALSQCYFKQVFSFSMNDEVLHTGFFPMSQYIFVLCTNKLT